MLDSYEANVSSWPGYLGDIFTPGVDLD